MVATAPEERFVLASQALGALFGVVAECAAVQLCSWAAGPSAATDWRGRIGPCAASRYAGRHLLIAH